jgi:hypothetical protein
MCAKTSSFVASPWNSPKTTSFSRIADVLHYFFTKALISARGGDQIKFISELLDASARDSFSSPNPCTYREGAFIAIDIRISTFLLLTGDAHFRRAPDTD